MHAGLHRIILTSWLYEARHWRTLIHSGHKSHKSHSERSPNCIWVLIFKLTILTWRLLLDLAEVFFYITLSLESQELFAFVRKIGKSKQSTISILWPNEALNSLGKRPKFHNSQWNIWESNWAKARGIAPGLPGDSSRVTVSNTKDSSLGFWNGKILLHTSPQLKLIVGQLHEALK